MADATDVDAPLEFRIPAPAGAEQGHQLRVQLDDVRSCLVSIPPKGSGDWDTTEEEEAIGRRFFRVAVNFIDGVAVASSAEGEKEEEQVDHRSSDSSSIQDAVAVPSLSTVSPEDIAHDPMADRSVIASPIKSPGQSSVRSSRSSFRQTEGLANVIAPFNNDNNNNKKSSASMLNNRGGAGKQSPEETAAQLSNIVDARNKVAMSSGDQTDAERFSANLRHLHSIILLCKIMLCIELGATLSLHWWAALAGILPSIASASIVPQIETAITKKTVNGINLRMSIDLLIAGAFWSFSLAVIAYFFPPAITLWNNPNLNEGDGLFLVMWSSSAGALCLVLFGLILYTLTLTLKVSKASPSPWRPCSLFSRSQTLEDAERMRRELRDEIENLREALGLHNAISPLTGAVQQV